MKAGLTLIKRLQYSVIKWETFIRKCFETELFPLGEKRENTLKNTLFCSRHLRVNINHIILGQMSPYPTVAEPVVRQMSLYPKVVVQYLQQDICPRTTPYMYSTCSRINVPVPHCGVQYLQLDRCPRTPPWLYSTCSRIDVPVPHRGCTVYSTCSRIDVPVPHRGVQYLQQDRCHRTPPWSW